MRKRNIRQFVLACFALSFFEGLSAQAGEDVIKYINPIIGASTSAEAGKSGHGLGKTFPGSATPFGLVQLSPDTKTGGDNGPGYSWHHPHIEGFSFIHMSGIGWYGDFGNFLVTPTVGRLHTNPGKESDPDNGYRSRYSHDREKASAGYYQVMLDDYGVNVELTSAPRAGMIRMTYPASDSSRIQIDLARRIGGTSTEQYIRQVDANTIEGWMDCPSSGGGWGSGDGNVNYKVYFYAQVSKPMTSTGVWSAEIPDSLDRKMHVIFSDDYQQRVKDAVISYNVKEAQGKHLGFFTEFATRQNEEVLLKCGISFVSIAGAKENLEHDIPGWDFNATLSANNALWRDALQNVRVEGKSDRDKTIFYTSLYHTMIDPRASSDVSGEYIGGDGKVSKTDGFVYRTIFSGWDVFRSQFPLQTIINPSLVNDEINSLISLAEKSGRFYYPRWEIMNSYSGCMIGNPAVSVLADAYMKGIRNYDVAKAFDYAVNSVDKFGNEPLGYTPRSISHTLEYAYTDWCVAQMANALGKKTTRKAYARRASNYATIWNDSVGWFCGKNSDGTWGEWKGKLHHDLYCVESNPFQQGWFVPQDVYGFIRLMGKEAYLAQLNEFFDQAPDNFLWNDYYNHPNEPVHQVPFMFAYAGKPYLTQKWTRKICEQAYGTDVMGLCGNEDVGQMSAWYVLTSMGIHPVCPGDNVYLLTSPVFDSAEITLDKNYYKGDRFTIKSHNNSPSNVYIKEVKLNGKKLDRAWITHNEIADGGLLEFFMSDTPNLSFGSKNLPPDNMKKLR